MMATRYQIEGDTKYANKTVEALLYSDKYIDCGYSPGGGFFGDYATAYDLIWQTKGVNSTLTEANNIKIRDKLAYVADYCYHEQNSIYGESYVDMAQQTGGGYPQVAIYGEILSDYTNASMDTTPADWAALGTTGSWVNDPLHTYERENTGAMSEAFNHVSGHNHAGSYKYYFDTLMIEYWNIWSNIHKRSFLDEYPIAKKVAMVESTFQVLPMNVMPSFGTDGNCLRDTGKFTYNLLDTTNRSIQKRAMDRQDTTKVLANPEVIGDYANHPFLIYTCYYNYPSLPLVPPTYTSILNKDGGYNVFREDWTNQSDWLSFIIWKDIVTTNRKLLHPDQFSIEYASHGDLLIAEAGENKYTPDGWNTYGSFGMHHNSLLIGGFDAFSKYMGYLTYRGIGKTDLVAEYYPASTTNLIQSPSIEYIDATVTIDKVELDENYVARINLCSDKDQPEYSLPIKRLHGDN